MRRRNMNQGTNQNITYRQENHMTVAKLENKIHENNEQETKSQNRHYSNQ